ncbi:NAD-dependent epimerase/dehydratase family protein [Mycolicibacterium brumae]|uniref:Epimerase n=1 Tax=Mycolicibacterium brumae TaxID=85968 RepID=A0A2G5PHF6_9MYCO|nr:NAD(P)-dependent oxidoreductase [Mycolicibacterium brumae]MCV7192385.1 NAD-dependent epimerase/dehydratase family protein [Mycolicibacterium brumae]PIB77590.1 epimerase [Mycolicibacterium brumae]RWA18625.1 hypothetical protein MBRU_05250 [Mycolicibacterium brumae DSM 44177]UWW10154.1 NAD-dependent epimerase/dehydratase family protein [Mycolicibacterium brumae]
MRIFLAGATGVIGRRLVPLLLAEGHTVAGLTRSNPEAVANLGAEPVVCDIYDLPGLREAVLDFNPSLVMHQLTDLPDHFDELEDSLAANERIRTEGTRNLLAAAKPAKMIAQSTAFPAAVAEHEQLVLDAGGVILRYGYFYGPGTWYTNELPPEPRVQIDEAARATVALLDEAPGTVVAITDLTV